MGKKIFVSYKYADSDVQALSVWGSTVRDYVTEFESKLDSSDDIYKGESDNDDLSLLSDDTIWEKLKDRIYDSSVTVVFISPNMRQAWKKDRDQWIPWEVSYSLKETSRKNKNGDPITSHSNAMLAVVLPDKTGSYAYYIEDRTCCNTGCKMHHTDSLFKIIRENKFNRIKNASKDTCSNNSTVWHGTCSYIEAVKWADFIGDYKYYVDKAIDRQEHIDEYSICKTI